MNFRLSHLRTTNVGACPKEKQNKCHNDFFEKQVYLRHHHYELSRINMRHIIIIVNGSPSYASPYYIKNIMILTIVCIKKQHAYFNFFISHLVLAEGSKINTKVDCGRGLIQLAMLIIVCRTVQFKEKNQSLPFYKYSLIITDTFAFNNTEFQRYKFVNSTSYISSSFIPV